MKPFRHGPSAGWRTKRALNAYCGPRYGDQNHEIDEKREASDSKAGQVQSAFERAIRAPFCHVMSPRKKGASQHRRETKWTWPHRNGRGQSQYRLAPGTGPHTITKIVRKLPDGAQVETRAPPTATASPPRRPLASSRSSAAHAFPRETEGGPAAPLPLPATRPPPPFKGS